MFAYCLNNPVVLADTSGTAAHVGFSADGRQNYTPWKMDSPGGGGWPADIHFDKQDYGSVADKFYTVRAIRMIQTQVARYNEIKTFDELRKEEFRRQQEALALKKAELYVSNPLTLVDTIFREVGLAGSLAGIYIEAGLIAVSPVGGAVLTVITVSGMVWTAIQYAIKEVMPE